MSTRRSFLKAGCLLALCLTGLVFCGASCEISGGTTATVNKPDYSGVPFLDPVTLPQVYVGLNFSFDLAEYLEADVKYSLIDGPVDAKAQLEGTVLRGYAYITKDAEFTLLFSKDDTPTARQVFHVKFAVKPNEETIALPEGTVGVAYSTQLKAAGQVFLPHWQHLVTDMPPGLAVEGAMLSGTPTQEGQYQFQITTYMDVEGDVIHQPYTVLIHPAPTPTESRELIVLPLGTVGQAYAEQLLAGGQVFSDSPNSNGLPPGLALTDTLLAGTPTAKGIYKFYVITSLENAVIRQPYSLTIQLLPATALAPTAPPKREVIVLPDGVVGTSYDMTVSKYRLHTPVQGDVFPGVRVAGTRDSTGLVGTPAQAGTFEFTVTHRDGADTHEQTYRVTINSLDLGFGDDYDIPDSDGAGPIIGDNQAGKGAGSGSGSSSSSNSSGSSGIPVP